MKFMLDSNVVIAVALAAHEGVAWRMAKYGQGDFAMSAITYAEVAHGSVRGKPPLFERLQAFVEEVPVLPFDDRAAGVYAKLSFQRGSYDRLIAAHALSLDLVLVTHNEKHFRDVPGLTVENWMA